MKHLKILGLAVIAAAALTAILGAGTASAYTLCTEGIESGNCKTGGTTHYASGTVFKASSTNAVLTVGSGGAFKKLDCNSAVSVKSTGTGTDDDTAVPGEVTSLTFSSCTSTEPDLGTCTVTEGKGYTGAISGNGTGGGTLTVTSTTSTTVTCGGFFSCTYTTAKNGVTLTVTGGNPAVFTASEVPLSLSAGGFGCGTSAKWDATYTLTSPTALWVGTKDA